MVRDAKNREVQLAELGKNEFFGEIASLSGRPRMATVTPLEDPEAWKGRETDKGEFPLHAERHQREDLPVRGRQH